MAVRSTLQIGDYRLKAINEKVYNVSDVKILQVITDLIETMRSNDLIGMAAPQIGEKYQIFVTEPRETKTRNKDQSDILRIYINPKIVNFSKSEVEIYEGCGSVLHGEFYAPVVRAKTITIEATDESGKKFRFTTDGILSRVIQHEYDHLHGIEFLEKVSDFSKAMTRDIFIETIKKLDWNKRASEITIKNLITV